MLHGDMLWGVHLLYDSSFDVSGLSAVTLCFYCMLAAFMFALRAASPVMGFMLGAWTTSIYVDLSGKQLAAILTYIIKYSNEASRTTLTPHPACDIVLGWTEEFDKLYHLIELSTIRTIRMIAYCMLKYLQRSAVARTTHAYFGGNSYNQWW